MCSLNVSLESIIIPKYFKLTTCVRGRKFRYISKSFVSLRFLLYNNTVFDFFIEMDFVGSCLCRNLCQFSIQNVFGFYNSFPSSCQDQVICERDGFGSVREVKI